ncbi:MAG: hypothetical protein M3Y64_08135 [Gemmatimonadota bacterium]|nr:hypothetical protein [Gemmatimonadota bacterium]
MMKWDIQQFLQDMDERNRESMEKLTEKVDNGFSVVNNQLFRHNTRIAFMERTHKTLRWFAATAVGAALVAVAEFFVNHHK